jgi:hypothetical protein
MGGGGSLETSVNLQTWWTDGVILSVPDPDPGNLRTATIGRTLPRRLMRLRVAN